MKNFKKVGCMLVGCAMVVSMFAGCSANKAAQQNTKKDATVSSQETDAAQLANEDGGAVKKTSQEIAMERLADCESGASEKTSQEIAKERIAARKAAGSKPTEPAEKETEQVTESTAAESEPTEPVVSMQNNAESTGASSKPATQTPTEPKAPEAPTEKPTEPPTTQPPATEPPATQPPETTPPETELPKVEIDTAALEAYGRQYAASLGFSPSTELNFGNAAYFPADIIPLSSTEEGYSYVAENVQDTYDTLMAVDGTIGSCRCNVIVEYNPQYGVDWYYIWVLYG